MEERMGYAILQSCRALKRRHRLEEGAFAPALAAISQALDSQLATELEEKVKALQLELNQSYQKHSQVSEKLVEEITESQGLRSQLSDKEANISQLQEDLNAARDRISQLEADEKVKEVTIETTTAEIQELKSKINELEGRIKELQAENEMLIERWMKRKMEDAEKLNEANSMYEDMMERLKAGRLEELARTQVDGIVRHSEVGADEYVEVGLPSSVKHVIRAHEAGCAAIKFEHGRGTVFSGGHDRLVKSWDVAGGTPRTALRGCLGSVLDLSLSFDNSLVLAACSDHKLYLWETVSSRMRHTLTGHTEKVVAVDISKTSNRRAVSAGYDRTMKTWDLQTGYSTNTLICYSNCNDVALTMSGEILCSGHMDGNLRLWDIRTGKQSSEVVAHAQGITSVSVSRNGHTILTSGRDNVHNLIDVRTLEVQASYRAQGSWVATNWSRSCLSPDDRYLAAGGTDGSVIVWTRLAKDNVVTLKGHSSPVLACAWSDEGKPLVTSDKSGCMIIWE
jgi:autophagy-related protein 16